MDSFIKPVLTTLCILTAILLIILIGVGLYNSGRIAAAEEQSKATTTAVEDTTPTYKARPNIQQVVPRQNLITDLSKQREVYAKLKETCNKWTKWWNKERTEISRINMNVSCKQAKDYAGNELNINTGRANNIAARSPNNPRKTVTANNTSSAPEMSPSCSSWKSQLKNIQAQPRVGYKEPRGNTLRRLRRELNELVQANC
jgi:hypothetical protein